jgi:hypothetical protein
VTHEDLSSCATLIWRHAVRYDEMQMKVAGFLLLVAGWILVLAAIALLGAAGPRSAFLLAGVGVEVLGLVLVARAHLAPKEDEA